MSFGLWVDGRTFEKGSIFYKSRTEVLTTYRGRGIHATMWIAKFQLKNNEVFSFGDTSGRFVYWSDAVGTITLITDAKITIEVDVYISSINTPPPSDSFGLEVFTDKSVGFTSHSAMLLLTYFKLVTLESGMPESVFDNNINVVCLSHNPLILDWGTSVDVYLSAFKVSGNRVDYAVARELWRNWGAHEFKGFTVDNLLIDTVVAVCKRL